MAAEIFDGADSTLEKVHRVVTHFEMNHEYTLGITIPPEADPLTYFLLERPPAHCEYFASGATILLRLGGVPCRYVTGYVAREKYPKGDYWMALSRDAHAWVEVWDEEEGWMIVEATPASGVPQGEEVSDESYAWDAWKLWFQQWKDALIPIPCELRFANFPDQLLLTCQVHFIQPATIRKMKSFMYSDRI